MTFQFAPQNNPGAPAAPQPVAAALGQAMAPPPVDIAGAIASAMQGVHDANMRHPFLPPDGQYDLTIEDVRAVNGYKTGLAFYIDVKVNQCNLPNLPADGKYSVRISGFNNPDAKGFAFADIKSFCYAALAQNGLTSAWNGTDGEWTKVINDMVSSGVCKGRRVFAQTALSTPGKQSGKPKLKCAWFVAQ
jgi:hypothetical protein